MISQATERMFEAVYADSRVDPSEMIRLQEQIDQAEAEILAQEGVEGVIEATTKSFDVTRQLLQESLLRIRTGDYSTLGEAQLMSILEANLAFLKTTFDAFSGQAR